MVQRARLVVRIRFSRESVEAFFWFDMKSGRFRWVFGIGSFLFHSTLLPLKDACPILQFFLVKLVFPFCFRLLAIFADVAALMAESTVSAFDVVIELTLRLRCNFVAIDDSFEVGSFEAIRKFGGLFMVGTAGEMGVLAIFIFIMRFRVRLAIFIFVCFVLCLVSFLFRDFRLACGSCPNASKRISRERYSVTSAFAVFLVTVATFAFAFASPPSM